jgi:hypothetical protein
MNWQNLSRVTALVCAAFLIAVYQFNPMPSWACSAGGVGGFSYASQTNSNSVTVCVKSVVDTRSTAPAKPATVPKPATPAKPAPKVAPKPIAKPAPAVSSKPTVKAPPKVVLLTPIKIGVPASLQKPKTVPKPVAKPVSKPPVKAVPVSKNSPATAAAKTLISTLVSNAEASFSPAPLSISASDNSVLQGESVSFSSNAFAHYKSGSLLGKSTQVFFQPAETLWRFGDGTSASGQVVGHSYSRVGDFAIEATVTYAVSCQIEGVSTWVDSGSITVSDLVALVVTSNYGDEDPPSIDVGKTVRLVGKNCFEKPGTFGCKT